MSVLDNRSIIKQIDPTNYLSHIFDIPEQLEEGFNLGYSTKIPALFAQAKQVIILSSIEMYPVALSLQSLGLLYARVPIIIVTDYILPMWVSSETLVIALDYAGNTEQVLTAFREAATVSKRLVAVSIEGDLGKEARRVRAVHIPLSYGAPGRIAFYYIFSCLAYVFRKLDLVDIREATITEAGVLSRAMLQNIGPDVPQFQNNAKQLAEKITQHPAVIIGSGPLVASAKKWELTIAASGKVHIPSTTLGEFNDTIINGMHKATKTTDALTVVMLQSKYDHARNKLQQTITYKVAQAQKVVYEQIFMHPSGSLFGELVLVGILGDMVSFYIALLRQVDPSVTEISRYIQEQLSDDPPLDKL